MIGALVFLVAILSICSFETTPVTRLPAQFWALAGTLGFLSTWASWHFDSASVIAANAVALVGAYVALKLTNGAVENLLALAVFTASAAGLLYQNGHHLTSTILILAYLIFYILRLPTIGNVLIVVMLITAVCGSAYGATWFSKVIIAGELEPTLSNLVLARVVSFLGAYLLAATIFALIYHAIYIHDPLAFRVSSDLVKSKLDLFYFIYWSFGVFVTFGPSELTPNTHLCRFVVVSQFFLGISWVTIFFSVFSTRLSKNTKQ